jgi:putative acetyltransferase
VSAATGYRRLALTDMAAAAKVFRYAFDERLPWLASLHTPDEDREFWRGQLFPTCEIWGAVRGKDVAGVIAFREGWIEQLYVFPAVQGQGIGSRLLDIAKAARDELLLWTFQRNGRARRFYEARDFTVINETGGAGNEEKEPDMLYCWHRAG